jgi:hypothetical protein
MSSVMVISSESSRVVSDYLVLRLKSTVAPVRVADRLLAIFERFAFEQDHLSLQINEWGFEFFECIQNPSTVDPEAFSASLDERIDILRHEILRDYRGVPFKRGQTARERNWVWTRSNHAEVKAARGISPLDHQPMVDDPEPHHYAEAMLEFIDEHMEMRGLNPDPDIVEEAPEVVIGGALSVRQAEQHQRVLQQFGRRVKEFTDSEDEITQLIIAEAKKGAERDFALVEERIAEIKESFETNNAQLRSEIETMSVSHQESIASIQALQAAVIEANRVAEEALRAEIATIDQANTQGIASLQALIEAKQQEAAEKVRSFQGQIASMESAHQAAVGRLTSHIGAIQSSHTALQAQAAANDVAARRRLDEATAVNRAQAREVAELRGTVEHLHHQVRNSGRKNKSCSIM